MSTESSSTLPTRKPLLLLPEAPPFYADLHATYIAELAAKLDAATSLEGAMTEHLRMSGVYWSLTALSLLQTRDQVDNNMELQTVIVEWVLSCFDATSGGFGGNVNQDGHMLYTLSALQILALASRSDDNCLDRLEDDKREAIIQFIVHLQQPDGSFCGDAWGEVDTRFTYCALQSLALLNALDRANVKKAADYVMTCQNSLDGGFGSVAGAESHAGQVFCCVAALSLANSLHLLEENNTADLLGWWLAERQVDSGGLNGRPEKQADVCYSWWILSALSILGKVEWINGDRLGAYILKCQDGDDGGIADRPDDQADVFHTFFGIAGLSLLGILYKDHETRAFRKIDPIYALPTDVVCRYKLPGQVMAHSVETVEPRLAHYNVVVQDKKNKKQQLIL